jgi:hypothetical protein
MSRAELEQCVLRQESIDRLGDEIEASNREISRLQRELKESERRITKADTLVDSYSKGSVDHFNSLLPPHQRLVASYNAKLPFHNKLVGQQNAAVESFNRACTMHPYYVDDMVYVLKKLGLYG